MKGLTSTGEARSTVKKYQLTITLVAALAISLTLPCLQAYSQPASPAGQEVSQDTLIPTDQLLQPNDLAKILLAAGGDKPLVLQVGSHVLFSEAHIRGSQYAGAAGQESGLQTLRERVRELPRNQFLVIYCGCCPWEKCPNIRPAFRELISMGFTHVRVLYIQDNLGTNWVAQHYPTAKGDQ